MSRAAKPAILIAVLLGALLGASGCRRGAKGGGGSGLGNIDDATLTYGYGPDLNGSAKYQPDVTIVRGGPKAIRWASADGLVWAIDGNAPGAKDLKEGQVMFVTSRAVGRVVKIEPSGSDLAVTLEPVSLTEVVRDANITVNQDFGPESVVFQEIPDLPGKFSVPPPLSSSLRQGVTASFASFRNGSSGAVFGKMPPAGKQSFKVAVGDWEVEPYMKTQEHPGVHRAMKFGIKIQHTVGSAKTHEGTIESGYGLKVGIDANFFARNFGIESNLPISNGKLGPGTTLLVHGIEELGLSLLAGAEKGLEDNTRVRIEVPIEMTEQIPPSPQTAGIPLVAQVKFKFIISTAFSSKNSTLSAGGKYALNGSIGYANGALVAPSFEVKEPILQSIQGIMMGPTAIVFAWEARSLLGIGIPAGMGGPYIKVVTSAGISRGSDLGLVKCRGVTLKLDVGGGVGTQMSPVVTGFLEKLLGKKLKVEMELGEAMKTVMEGSVVAPDVPLCKAA